MGLDDIMENCSPAVFGIGCVVVTVCCCCCVAIILTLALVIDSINYVNYDEYGIDYNIYTKIVGDKVYEPGRYFTGVGNRFLKFPRIYKTVEFSNLGITGNGGELKSRTFDGLSMSLEISFQYRLKKNDVLEVFNLFGVDYETVYIKIARDVLRDVASKYNATQFFDERKVIGADMKTELANRLAEVKGTVDFLQLRKVDLPDAYENIIEQKEIVRQDIKKAEFEREQKTVTANTDVMVAEKKAQIKIVDAQATAESIILQAAAAANGTRLRVAAESDAYAALSTALGFNTTELLSYLWIQAVREHDSAKLIVNLDKPAVLNVGN